MKWKNSLAFNIWLYLAFFMTSILVLLWVLQVLLLNVYYEWSIKKSINNIKTSVVNYYESNKSDYNYDKLSYDNNACIEIYKENSLIYSSQSRRGCIEAKKGLDIVDYKSEFYLSDLNEKSYTLINPTLNNKTLIRAIKLSDSVYAFINVSLEPMDSSIKILTEELIYITIFVFISSFLIAFYLSKRISKPIVNISKCAKEMASGNYEKTFVMESDISEIQELSETLDYARKELSKTNELRRDLMANVSHDLKTPLTMIKAYAEMASDININNKIKRNENLHVIIEETERLNVLVNDILDLAENESKINELIITNFNLTKLIKTIITRFDYLKLNEGYNIIFNTKEDIIVYADEKKITQVIYNLITNAINYTGKNKKVYIILEKNKKFVRVNIKDTGKGIDKEDVKFIWDKYYKNEKHHQRNKVGTGLGLSIVKSILLNHKYNYGVNSIKGKGSTFYFDIKV